MRRFGPPLALVLAAAALSGCGGDGAEGSATDAEAPAAGVDVYVEEVRAAEGTLRSASDRLAAGTTSAELAALLAELEAAVRRVEQATPPYDLLPEHQRMTQSLWIAIDAGQGLVVEGAGELGTADLGPVTKPLDEAAEALEDMEEKGYEVRRRT